MSKLIQARFHCSVRKRTTAILLVDTDSTRVHDGVPTRFLAAVKLSSFLYFRPALVEGGIKEINGNRNEAAEKGNGHQLGTTRP